MVRFSEEFLDSYILKYTTTILDPYNDVQNSQNARFNNRRQLKGVRELFTIHTERTYKSKNKILKWQRTGLRGLHDMAVV